VLGGTLRRYLFLFSAEGGWEKAINIQRNVGTNLSKKKNNSKGGGGKRWQEKESPEANTYMARSTEQSLIGGTCP